MNALAQPSLFDDMQMTAVFGGWDNIYRYELRRVWNADLPMLVVCMLNPSTADHQKNDPTILALIHFAKLWGYGGLLIVNLYAFRSSSPAVMFKAEDPVGPYNLNSVHAAILYAHNHGGKMLAAWGNDGQDPSFWFIERALNLGVELICLGTTRSGAPKHPMARGLHRIPRDQQPITWRTR
ncbi:MULTISPECIES: DUF1643 domain-containing protein [Mesorhizobium]|uniref:DUF1643 domain-containing protein n=1 Tax=Mesorhizobium TaxID=68287 RepID=UPI0007A93FE9|nr:MULTISPECIES: DUF1643 domain-containing protein [Mesorhizobium]AMX93747.1 hypothetical protein A4R28_11845 [Mesorhizobium ciceri]MDF3208448.1 DUF1643 domain-containing protein [Mesorhizobium sp. LMG15046]MDF3228981.1 DUF1643 domain-containing protein [Mesorhizobium sp. DSM 30133]RUU22100.1 DUF1643 domain-containing protein [Mesorhizobium sp. Primo-B]RUU37990.1 DUF1643 domain-containing protein [Mesorhizobium sp. Primo-A]